MQIRLHDLPPNFLPICLAVCFVLWLIGSFLFSVLSGWHALAGRFRMEEEPDEDALVAGPLFQKVTMRSWGIYYWVIRMRSAKDALYLSMALPFRIGHPPLRIPWDEIRLSERTTLLGWRMILTLGLEEQVPMRISARVASKLGLV